jgi:hypothetical protein
LAFSLRGHFSAKPTFESEGQQKYKEKNMEVEWSSGGFIALFSFLQTQF